MFDKQWQLHAIKMVEMLNYAKYEIIVGDICLLWGAKFEVWRLLVSVKVYVSHMKGYAVQSIHFQIRSM